MSAQASVNVHVFNTIFPGYCVVLHIAGAAQGCPDCWSNITYMPGVQCAIQFSPGTAWYCINAGDAGQTSPTCLVFNTIFPGYCVVLHNAGAAQGCPDFAPGPVEPWSPSDL